MEKHSPVPKHANVKAVVVIGAVVFALVPLLPTFPDPERFIVFMWHTGLESAGLTHKQACCVFPTPLPQCCFLIGGCRVFLSYFSGLLKNMKRVAPTQNITPGSSVFIGTIRRREWVWPLHRIEVCWLYFVSQVNVKMKVPKLF